MSQNDVFYNGEGDSYYRRNKNRTNVEGDMPLKLIAEPPSRVLDVGCANPWRLDEIHKRYGCTCVGLDPSADVVAGASKEFPHLDLVRGFAHAMPFEETFDLVIINFAFCWMARETLLRSVAEIDRIASKYVIIGDFMADAPKKREYHYLPGQGVYTFKLDYAKLFTDAGTYREVKREIYNFDPHTQGVCSLLQKSDCYVEEPKLETDYQPLPAERK